MIEKIQKYRKCPALPSSVNKKIYIYSSSLNFNYSPVQCVYRADKKSLAGAK